VSSLLVTSEVVAATASVGAAGIGALRLARAAGGLRRRVGLHAWPLLRREEADLVAG
jgi:hypothetical protein